MQWSLDLLGMDTRELFDEMCIFPAAFDIRALDAVTQVESPYGAFGELVDASLVNVQVDEGRQTYQILEPIRQVGLQNVSEEIVEAYLIWVDDVTASIEASWIEGQPAVAVERLVRVLDDVQQAWLLLENRNRHDECELLARRVALPLTIRPDVALVSTILASEATTGNGLMAHASLAWGAGRPHDALADVDRLLEIVPAADPLVPLAYWGSTPACSFAGDAERMIRQGTLGFRHSAASPAPRAYFAGYWALGELYRGEPRVANELIVEHASAIDHVDTGGFISFVRAEIAATEDLAGALDILRVGKDEADHAGMLMFSRMIEIATLSLHVRAGNHRVAIGLARSLVGRLIASGLLAQAWMTLRHVASLLADIGEYKLAIRVLDAADSSPEAPELFGDAVAGDRLLRRRLTQLTGAPPTGPNGAQPAPSAGDLWPEVDETLARVGAVGSARERSAARPRTDRDGLSRPQGSATKKFSTTTLKSESSFRM